MQPISKLVLVTGPNGYLGTHVVAQLLQQGYKVRAAVRSQTTADKMLNVHAKHGDSLTITIVPDITTEGAFDEAVKGVNGVSADCFLLAHLHTLTSISPRSCI